MDMSPSKERNIDQRKLRKAKSQVSNITYLLYICYIPKIFLRNINVGNHPSKNHMVKFCVMIDQNIKSKVFLKFVNCRWGCIENTRIWYILQVLTNQWWLYKNGVWNVAVHLNKMINTFSLDLLSTFLMFLRVSLLPRYYSC